MLRVSSDAVYCRQRVTQVTLILPSTTFQLQIARVELLQFG
jgi:hypothetical protein